ncbi:MAG: hypothetical protein ABW252_06505 [Polyangiales bacterium]
MSQPHPRSSTIRRRRASLAAFLCASVITSASCGSDPAEETDDDDGGGSGGGAFTRIYNSSQFQQCAGCHAPNAPGKVAGTESSQDWSTRDKAYASLKKAASGMIGNFAGCNGVPLLGSSPANSLLVASLDEDVRADFSSAAKPDCNGDAISDMTLKIGAPLPASLLAELKAWITAGAPND